MDRRRRPEASPPPPSSTSPSSGSDSDDDFDLKQVKKRERGCSEGEEGEPPAHKRRLVAGRSREGGDGLPQGGRSSDGKKVSEVATFPRFLHREYAVQMLAACFMFCYGKIRESAAKGVPLSVLPPELVELICRFLVSGCNLLVRFKNVDRLNCVAALQSSSYVPLECVSLADGRQYLASGGRTSATVDLWDLAKRECLATLVGHEDDVYCLASLTGRDGAPLLASGSVDTTIILWDVVTHHRLATLAGHTDAVVVVAVFWNASTGYQCLASGSLDGTIMLWDPRKYFPLASLHGHNGAVCSLSVWRNTDSTAMLASGGDDDIIRVWDLTTHQTLFSLAGHTGSIRCLSCFTNADGVPMLVSGCFHSDQLWVWDLESRVAVAAIQGASPTRSLVCVAGVDGRVLAACTTGNARDDGALRLYDLSTGVSAEKLKLLWASTCIAFVDEHSGISYLAVSRMNSIGGSGVIELLIGARAGEP
jgi:WD domain, G-beta repeat